MPINSPGDKMFLKHLTEIVEANLNDEQFGVSELALKIGMSHSRLYFRIKSLTQKSISQFIREIRLNKALELLKQTDLNISEIAFKVGFSSPAYFNNCFHKQFGYPPGELKRHVLAESETNDHTESVSQVDIKKETKKQYILIAALAAIIIMSGSYMIYSILANNPSEVNSDINPEISVIVLPFKNLSSDEGNQYFADGITEDIINQLTKIPGIKVLSRTSTEQFRNTTLSSPEIGEKMNVSHILAGSIRRQDNDVRIIVQFIEAKHDVHLWSENYDRQMDDIFDIQSDIARNVADKLQIILPPEEIRQIENLNPKNTEAYDKFLMGQYFMLQRDSVSIRRGIEYFEKAIEIEPEYTRAYAGLANGYYALAFTGRIERSTGYDRAYEMAEKALEKDSTLAEAYAVLGAVNKFGYWKWEEARKYFKKAIEVDSNCMVAHLYYASFLDIVGEPDNAMKHVNRAIELEPYFNLPWTIKSAIYKHEKKYTEALSIDKRRVDLNPSRWATYNSVFYDYFILKDEASAVETLKKVFSLRPGFQKYEKSVSPVYEESGMNGVLKLYLEAILREDKNACPIKLYVLLGMQDEALVCLEKRCRVGRADIPRMIRADFDEDLQSNPRFQALVDTMNLRPYFPTPSD